MTLAERLIFPVMKCRGPLTNQEIYRVVRKRARKQKIRLTPHWKATIRNTLQRHTKGHPKCRTHKPLFIHLGRSLWRTRHAA